MSTELDAQIDAARAKLIATANTPIGMGNYKQQIRAFQEVALSMIDVLDDLNQEIDKELGKPEGAT